MIRIGLLMAALAGLAAVLSAAEAPAPEAVQGLYEGRWKDARGEADAEVRCVATGGNGFKLLARRTVNGGVERAEINGKGAPETGVITFAGRHGEDDWRAEFAAGAIKGTIGAGGVLDVKRVKRRPPTLGKRPPQGAVVLFDGKQFDHMKARGGAWNPVDERDGSMQVPKAGMESVATFEGGYDAHVEFMCPLEPRARSQGRGNSGCYQPCGTEIQILDSFGMPTYTGGGCGGLYRSKDPDTMEPIPSLEGKTQNVFTLASLPPLEWQTYDVQYRVKTNAAGQQKGYLTVLHNGIKIHDNVELRHRPGRFFFQDHRNPVRYRNIWVLERKE
jgi:hypothetical protein